MSSAPATVQIALCCNAAMLPGLHATLSSLVRHLGRRDSVALTLFARDMTEPELEAIRGTVSDAGGVHSFDIREGDISEFKGLRALQGDWMTYLRLFLPKLLPGADTILYLDSDLIVNTDACRFFDLPLGEFPIGAVPEETVEWNLDGKFLKTVGLANEDICFNGGVLLLNARVWRETGLMDKALEFGKAHTASLGSADQTILLALFSRHFYRLPKAANLQIAATTEPLVPADGIYHFVGSPKPWDPLGRLIHRNWPLWHATIQRTRFHWGGFILGHVGAFTTRAWTLRRSYLKNILRR